MTTLTLDPGLGPPATRTVLAGDVGDGQLERRGGEPSRRAPQAAEGRGRSTLDELIVGVWEDLSAHHAVACPICAGPMTPRYGSGPAPVGGRCSSCGTTLA